MGPIYEHPREWLLLINRETFSPYDSAAPSMNVAVVMEC